MPERLDHPRLELETSLELLILSKRSIQSSVVLHCPNVLVLPFFYQEKVLANLILFPRIPDKKSLEEPPTPIIVHVRSLLDLTNYVSYLLYGIDSLSLSQ
ncbi:hypothetical protein Ahy_A02g005985 [Arachis hypogaea]|uniref:Uncharacterized protein n=1 Tax=Arachis hypogaea TaxID=3818 RepID=A0A445E8B7_ARAHY|nr:hypothetical protein Ahy_A02g005985 [Arachis hypogaea]